ncbi:hypothetical protein BIFANG_02586 [Bifidobacterium angulatum DSM 20098 = JCM 7096]|uniref:Uncharacterized protein n=1 Tax=Bifidobacterium angulatum DSM 20098 = JCM 7096 TaxID=518635 RepID=C4FE46_9BIFI|nr:hypothetical protein BIFANG_02586 [Bifidobacterium angulatum DSM 20098 = JCM 7096]
MFSEKNAALLPAPIGSQTADADGPLTIDSLDIPQAVDGGRGVTVDSLGGWCLFPKLLTLAALSPSVVWTFLGLPTIGEGEGE